jgi:beta-N-acetylhexosaminidase
LVVRDAFLAGSDLLFLGNIRDTGAQDNYTTTINILDFFAQKYREDLAFAQRVDESVLRILTLKYRIFPNFSLGSVIPARENLDRIGDNQQITFEVAQQGATLISPSLSDLDSVLPDAPGINDRIVFFSDEILFRQCLDCPQQTALAKDAFQQAVFRLYGPDAGNQVLRGNLSSFTFADLQTILDTNERGSPVESSLRGAQWIVFAMLDVRSERPESQALRRLLSERPELLQGKRVIAFAFNAPYYLDATDISKLTAYYALYNKSPEFLDIAVRILFKEFTPTTGASPVSVPGIGYDLISATSPDPEQEISLLLDLPLPVGEVETSTPEPNQIQSYNIGDTIPIRTGTIVDNNGHAVPHGTPVQFIFNLAGEVSFSAPVESSQGVAKISYVVNSPGRLEISAISEPANLSIPLQIDIPGSDNPPTEEPVLTPTQTQTPSPSPEPTNTMAPATEETPTTTEPHTKTDFADWVLALVVTTGVGGVAYQLGYRAGNTRWSIRWALSAFIGGTLIYTFVATNLPGSEIVFREGSRVEIIWSVFLGAIIGWGVGIAWQVLNKKDRISYRTKPPNLSNTKFE